MPSEEKKKKTVHRADSNLITAIVGIKHRHTDLQP